MTAVAAVRRLVPLLLAAGVLAAAPTPTPAPRLSGGFGKAPAAGSAKASRAKGAVKITNQSLVTEPDKGNLSTSSARPSPTAAAPVTTPAAPGATAAPGPTTSPAGGEEYWRGEATRLRERVAALTEAIARLQNEVVKLEADFYSWDDGAYRDGVIKPAWDKAREELVTARRELPIAQKELADLPERARKAGAAPGWIRE